MSNLEQNTLNLQIILNTANLLPDVNSGDVADPVIEPLAITENGTYTAPVGVDGYSPVSVNVPIPDGYIKPSGTLEITENGEYDVSEKEKVVVDIEPESESLTYKTCTIKIVNGSPEISYAKVFDGIVTCVKNQEIQSHFYAGKTIYDDEEFLLENVLCSSGFELNYEITFPQTVIGVSGGIEVADTVGGQPFLKAPSEDGSVGVIEIFNEELPWG